MDECVCVCVCWCLWCWCDALVWLLFLNKNTCSHEVWHFVKWISVIKTNVRQQSQPPHYERKPLKIHECNERNGRKCVCVACSIKIKPYENKKQQNPILLNWRLRQFSQSLFSLLLWFVIESSLVVHASKITSSAEFGRVLHLFLNVLRMILVCVANANDATNVNRSTEMPVDISILLDVQNERCSIGLPPQTYQFPIQRLWIPFVTESFAILHIGSHNNRFSHTKCLS